MDDRVKTLLEILKYGTMELKGEFQWGSNYTYLAQLSYEDETVDAVYKPIRGERPLWDFPPASLAKREVAAFYISEALGWQFVPPTVYREDGPLGSGSLQLFVDHNPDYHYFNFTSADLDRLRPVALFDVLINNADRKGSHIIFDPQERMWLIDHGVCFHVQDKLRTVIWDFASQSIPDDLCADMNAFLGQFRLLEDKQPSLLEALEPYLHQNEIKALELRTRRLIERGNYPSPDPGRRHFPWPQI